MREIRVKAIPNWQDEKIQLEWWFIVKDKVRKLDEQTKDELLRAFQEKFKPTDKYTVVDGSPRFAYLEDITAKDYLESDRLDFDYLSVSKPK